MSSSFDIKDSAIYDQDGGSDDVDVACDAIADPCHRWSTREWPPPRGRPALPSPSAGSSRLEI